MGKVTAISGSTITITNAKTSTTYTVDASNATVTKSGVTSATVSNIVVGDTISVAGTVSGTNVTATTIHDGFGGGSGGQGGFGGRGGFGGGTMGTVTAISGTTLTVTTKSGGVYTVDASSATVKESGTASAVSDIKVGDTVMIQGSITTASMTAKNIEDGVPTPPTSPTTTTSAAVVKAASDMATKPPQPAEVLVWDETESGQKCTMELWTMHMQVCRTKR